MKQEDLISKYTVAQFKPHVDKCNKSKVPKEFDDLPQYNVIVSNLTYVHVGNQWIMDTPYWQTVVCFHILILLC